MYTFLSDQDRFKIRVRVTGSQAKRIKRDGTNRSVASRYSFPNNLIYDLFRIKGIKPIPEICGMLDRPEAYQQIMSYGLSDVEQTVLSMLYVQQMPLKDVSASLRVSSSPLSLIRDNALNKIWIQLM